MMKLSVAMIVKNEEKNLERTLIPLKELGKNIDVEIVVVDTGSTDNTVDIAKKYTNKIYFHKWNNDFASMRNISVGYCTGDWILILDADEVLYDIDELASIILNNKLNDYNSAFIKIINFNEDVKNSIENGYLSPLLRLFKKDTIQYEGIVHEQPKFKRPIIDTKIRFIHYGYDNTDYELMEYKFKRNLNLLLEQLEKDPDNVYTNFQIAVTYNMHNDLSQALKYIEIAYDKAKKDIFNYVYVIDKYCLILYELKNYNALLSKAKEGIENCSEFIDFYFYLGEAYHNLNQYDNAIDAYNKYLNYYNKYRDTFYIPNSTLSILTMGYKNNVLHNIALCYYRKNYYDNALNVLLKIEDKEFFKNKIYFLIKVIIEGRLYNKFELLNNLVDKYNYEIVLNYLNKDVLMEELSKIETQDLKGDLKEIVHLTKYAREQDIIDKKHIEELKMVILRNNSLYCSYVYFVLKADITELKYFKSYGKDELESVLTNLCEKYFDFYEVMINGLNKFGYDSLEDIFIRNIILKVLLRSKSIPRDKKKNLFLTYVYERYYTIRKSYNKDIVENNLWILNSEERFIIELKNALSYKFNDPIKYIRSMKEILNVEKAYVDYIKLIIEEDKDFEVNKSLKDVISELINSIQALINIEKYQEAFDAIEEALSLVKFDFDLMLLKYNLLLQFNYQKEAQECLKDIILYGDSKKVMELIN